MTRRSLAVFAVLLTSVASFAGKKQSTKKASATKHYEVSQKVKLGGEGRWDYLTVDDTSGRIFITRSTHVMVVDENTLKPVGDIPDLHGIHGVALAHDAGKGYVSEGETSKVAIFAIQDLKKDKEVEVGNTPDAITYDPFSKQVFTFNARGQDSTVLDETGARVGDIPLGGKPEFAVADGNGEMFVNIEDTSELAAIDTKARKVRNRWPLKPCEEPTGLALDQANRRLFVGCSNKLMAIVNADSGQIVQTVPIGDGVDATAYDAGTGLAFASCGEGVLTVIKQDTPDKYSVAENVVTQRGARTMALDPKTHVIYLVTADFGPPPAATADNPHPRPSMVPGTFTLLVARPK